MTGGKPEEPDSGCGRARGRAMPAAAIDGGEMMFYDGNLGVGWFGGLVIMLIWLVVVGLLVWVVVRIIAGPRGRDRYWGPPGPPADDPEQILRSRFARGEIGPDEFEQRLDVLRRTRPPTQPPR